jgi:hypothetical protein
LPAFWAIGFFRNRNFGFLLLAFAALGECVAALVRQAVVNYILYHQTQLSVSERSSMVGIVASVFLVIGIIFWLLVILGAILSCSEARRLKPPSKENASVWLAMCERNGGSAGRETTILFAS